MHCIRWQRRRRRQRWFLYARLPATALPVTNIIFKCDSHWNSNTWIKRKVTSSKCLFTSLLLFRLFDLCCIFVAVVIVVDRYILIPVFVCIQREKRRWNDSCRRPLERQRQIKFCALAFSLSISLFLATTNGWCWSFYSTTIINFI